VLALLEGHVVRQVELAMQVHEPVALVVAGAVVRVHPVPVLDEARHDPRRAGSDGEPPEPLVVRVHREVGVDLADRIAREVELREHDQLGAVVRGLLHDLPGPVQVLVDVAQNAVDLGKGDPRAHLLTARFGL
jgi:hypothetical protein